MGNTGDNNEGYYDENGNFIGFFYDEGGNLVEGYIDEYGSYALAYYDENDNYIGGGYFDENGEYVEYATELDESALQNDYSSKNETQNASQSAGSQNSKSKNEKLTNDLQGKYTASETSNDQDYGEYNIDFDDDLTYENLDDFSSFDDDSYGSKYKGTSRKNNSSNPNTSNKKSSVNGKNSKISRNSYNEYRDEMPARRKKKFTPGKVIGRVVIAILAFLLITVGGVYATIYMICKGPSEAAKNLFVSTIQETGQMKFVNKLFFSEEEILAITGKNSMGTLDEELNTDLITIGGNTDGENVDGEAEEFDIDGFELIELTGRTYYAKMMIINDPSRVKLSTIYNGAWAEYGKCLDEFVDEGNYLAGVNGGEYQSDSNKGGHPKGIVVCDGEIQYNNPQAGDVLIGFNTDDILIIRDVGNLSAAQAESLVKELNIRDCVTFKDIDDGDDNHFAKLIINGEAISLTGSGSGANPRTVIGQRADGTVLILVTDGRGASGHLGATAADLVSIMTEYGAVNAANMDGGSSSSMYYDGEYEMTSVTLYYANSSWRLPLAFVVERRD